MKTKLTMVIAVMTAVTLNSLQKANGQANTALSNLSSTTSVNHSLLPNSDSVRNLGNASKSWGNAYLYQLNLRKNKAGNGSILNANGIELGYGVGGKEVNAGKIGYAMFTPNALDIVGAGNTSFTRAIKFWAEAGASFRGNINVSHHSSISVPQLLLSETQNDYSRLNFKNTATANFFAIAALPQATTASARLNFYYSATGDVMTIRGDGKVGIGTATPTALLHVTSQTESTAIYGVTNAPSGTGVLGEANNGSLAYGIWGKSTSGNGVVGQGNHYGVWGVSSAPGFAGYFTGNVHVTGDLSWASDQKLKENIKPVDKILDKIMLLKPSSYNFKKEYNKMNLAKGEQIGFIAQDLEKVFPQLVKTIIDQQPDKEKQTEYKGVNYISLIPLLTKAIQEQQEEISELKQEVKRLSGLTAITENTASVKTINVSDAVLNQNVPNPFSSTSSIQYNIPAHFKSAELVVANENGIVIKQIPLNTGGKGTININAYNLSNGIYTYSLVVNGSTIESKKMIVGK